MDKLSIYYNHYQITVFLRLRNWKFFRKVAVKQFEIVGLEIGELYKNSCLNGEIYRAKNCTTNETTLNLALQDLEQVFINNQYPKSLIKSKIDEIKKRNFAPNPNKAIREEDQKNPDLRFFYFSLPYTSYRCSKIASKIKNILSKYTPNYRLQVCFKTITPK